MLGSMLSWYHTAQFWDQHPLLLHSVHCALHHVFSILMWQCNVCECWDRLYPLQLHQMEQLSTVLLASALRCHQLMERVSTSGFPFVPHFKRLYLLLGCVQKKGERCPEGCQMGGYIMWPECVCVSVCGGRRKEFDADTGEGAEAK